jgi:hypothetical protein
MPVDIGRSNDTARLHNWRRESPPIYVACIPIKSKMAE